jgi:hypothetical protein
MTLVRGCQFCGQKRTISVTEVFESCPHCENQINKTRIQEITLELLRKRGASSGA